MPRLSIILTAHCRKRLYERFSLLPQEQNALAATALFAPVGYQSGRNQTLVAGQFMGYDIVLAGVMQRDGAFVAKTALERDQAVANMQTHHGRRVGLARDLVDKAAKPGALRERRGPAAQAADLVERKRLREVQRAAEVETAWRAWFEKHPPKAA